MDFKNFFFKQYLHTTTLLLALTAGNTYGKNVLQLSEIKGTSVNVTICEEVFRAALEELGIQYVVRQFPGNRGLSMSNRGMLDGEIFRTTMISDFYPNLIKVDVPCAQVPAFIYTKKNKSFKVDGWSSIPKEYIVGVRRGIKVLEYNLRKHEVKNIRVDTETQALDLLKRNRIDAFVSGKFIQNGNDDNALVNEIVQLEPPIYQISGYVYMNKKHQSMIPSIEKTLKRMTDNGFINEIKKRHFSIDLNF